MQSRLKVRLTDLEQQRAPQNQIAVVDVRDLSPEERARTLGAKREQMQRDGSPTTTLIVIDF